jgi:hypothetical protein
MEDMKLNVKAFALAGGIVWGVNWFALTWWMILFKGITYEKIAFISDSYVGFTLSPLGSLVALLYGFIDGFFIGLMIAWVYNKIAPRLRSKEE